MEALCSPYVSIMFWVIYFFTLFVGLLKSPCRSSPLPQRADCSSVIVSVNNVDFVTSLQMFILVAYLTPILISEILRWTSSVRFVPFETNLSILKKCKITPRNQSCSEIFLQWTSYILFWAIALENSYETNIALFFHLFTGTLSPNFRNVKRFCKRFSLIFAIIIYIHLSLSAKSPVSQILLLIITFIVCSLLFT